MKLCVKCDIIKENKFFYKNRNVCKVCVSVYEKEWREKNKERMNVHSKNYRKNNLEKVKELQKNWYQNNKEIVKEKSKEYKKNNLEKVKKIWKNYRIIHKKKLIDDRKEYNEKNRKKLNAYAVSKRNSNPINKVSHNMRTRIKHFLKTKKITKNNKTFEIIGCTPEELKEHLEKQFTEGMRWENYGYYGWHVDHRIPLDSAKTEEEIYKLCHFKNLQPLWKNDNLKKGKKII